MESRVSRIAVLLALVLFAALAMFTNRPEDVAMPSFPVFFGLAAAPSLAAWLPTAFLSVEKMARVVAAVAAASTTFAVVYLIQLQLILPRIALAQSNHVAEGLLSNFYVFGARFLHPALLAVVAISLMHTLLRRSSARKSAETERLLR